MTLNVTPSCEVADGTQTNVSCTANTNHVTPQLYRNGSLVSNPNIAILAIGTYNYACNITETQNYTKGEVSNTLIVYNCTDEDNDTYYAYDNVTCQIHPVDCNDSNPDILLRGGA